MVLMTGEAPMGYLVPSLPRQIPVIRIDGWLIQPQDGSRLTAEARARVAAFKGDLYLIANPYEINRGARGAGRLWPCLQARRMPRYRSQSRRALYLLCR